MVKKILNAPETQVKLSMVNQNKGIKLYNHVAAPGCHCPMHTSLSIFRQLKGVSTLVVGTSECTYYSRMVIDYTFNDDEQKHYTYLLDSNEVVFGCQEGIVEALKTMMLEGAKYILVLMTCIPALIGEDFNDLVELDEDIGIQVIDVAHFKRNGYMSGYYMTMEAICAFMKPLARNKKQINLWGTSPKESEELSKLRATLELNGFKVLCFNGTGHINDYNKASSGILNIICSYQFLGVAKGMKKRFNTEYAMLFDVYDVNTITERYEQIGQICQMPNLAQSIKDHITGKLLTDFGISYGINSFLQKEYKILITSQDIVSLSFVYSLSLYGIIPDWVHIEEMDEVQLSWRNQLLVKGIDPYVTYFGTKIIEETGENHIIFGEGIDDEYGLYKHSAYSLIKSKGQNISIPRSWFMALQKEIGFERVYMLQNELLRLGIVE